MNKEQYLKGLETIKKDRKTLDEKQAALKAEYIESSKPCNIEDQVKITLGSGRVVKGAVVAFGILSDGNVNIISYREGNKNKYITTPHLKVELL
jgi:hypothetical protein